MKAVIQESGEFRIYEAEEHLGDADFLVDTIQAPVRCKSHAERRTWLNQTLFAKSLGDYEFVGDAP